MNKKCWKKVKHCTIKNIFIDFKGALHGCLLTYLKAKPKPRDAQ